MADAGMLNESDVYVGKITEMLKEKDYWSNTFGIKRPHSCTMILRSS